MSISKIRGYNVKTMDLIISYIHECRGFQIDAGDLQYLTVMPKDVQIIISKPLEKDIILSRFINHLIQTYLLQIYDLKFLNLDNFKTEIIRILRLAFGSQSASGFDFSEYKSVLLEEFYTDISLPDFANKLEKYYFNGDCSVRWRNINDKICNVESQLKDLFTPMCMKLGGPRLKSETGHLWIFILKNLKVENFELKCLWLN